LYVINAIILYIQAKVSTPGSDHPYHLGLINSIRENKHRFVGSFPNIIGEKNFAYPQFFHWVLSLIPKNFLDKQYHLIGVVLNTLSLTLFIALTIWVYPLISSNISIERFVLYAGLLYIMTPFSWAIWNAKNTEVSARGLGLFLGYLYQILLLLYYNSGNWVFLFFIFVIVFGILLSSQFANQYVLFTLPFFAFFYNIYFILVFPPLAFLLFYIINKNVALSFVRGQYWHKTIYYKYLAKIFILSDRPSIWRDLIYDIWKNIINNSVSGILYAYHNSLISITIGIPSLAYLIFIFSGSHLFYTTEIERLLFYNIIIALIVFFLTSFRKTRFLGEPERYVEFVIPCVAILAVSQNSGQIEVVNILLIVSSVLIALQLLVQFITKHKQEIKGYNAPENVIVTELKRLHKKNLRLRVFSNNKSILKYALETDVKVLLTNLTSINTGNFSFSDIYSYGFPVVNQNVIVPMIIEHKINCFIMDSSKDHFQHIPRINELNYSEYKTLGNYTIYLVSCK